MTRPGDREARENGRRASAPELADRLGVAEPAYLEGALENAALDEEMALVLLRNRGAPERLLRELSRRPAFRRSYAVRRGLVRHPNTPRAVAMELVHHLYWRDLAGTADDYRAAPPVRRVALKLLESRLDDLALGEQLTLARTAGRSVVLALRRTRHEAVARALLENASLVEDDLIAMVSSRDTPVEILGLVARTPRWLRRYPVRTALLRSPRTPVGVALGLLSGLLRGDLEAVAHDPEAPTLLRRGAERVLRERGLPLRPPPEPAAGEAYVLEEE